MPCPATGANEPPILQGAIGALKRKKAKLVWTGLAVVSVAGAATTVEGAIRGSGPVAVAGVAMAFAVPAAWILCVMTDIFLSLQDRLRLQPRVNRNR